MTLARIRLLEETNSSAFGEMLVHTEEKAKFSQCGVGLSVAPNFTTEELISYSAILGLCGGS